MIQIVWYAIYSGHRDNKQQNSMDHNLHVCEWKHNISAAGLRIHSVQFDLRAFGMCTMYFLGFNMHNWSIADDHCVVEICIKNYYYLLLTLDKFFFLESSFDPYYLCIYAIVSIEFSVLILWNRYRRRNQYNCQRQATTTTTTKSNHIKMPIWELEKPKAMWFFDTKCKWMWMVYAVR